MTCPIAVISQKGGTGKTTTVRTLADAFRRVGLSVLVIDLDPQGNLSEYFDVPADAHPTIAEVLQGEVLLGDAIHRDIVPANLRLAEAELALAGKLGREMVLKKILRESEPDADIVLMDCPPNLGLLTVNALVAASHALIACETQYFALQGLEQSLQVIELVRDGLNQDLSLLGVAATRANLRTKHGREALQQLQENHGDVLLEPTIRHSVAYAEAAERAVSILDYRPDLASDYLGLSAVIASKIGHTAAAARIKKLI